MTVYFLIPEFSELHDDATIYLGEGLKELGINFSSNIDYWQINLQGEFLFNKTLNDPRDYDVVVLSNQWTQHINPLSFKFYGNPLPNWLFAKGKAHKTVYLDAMDGYNTFSYSEEARQFDFILRSKKNCLTINPNNVHSWVLGFSNRILTEKNNIPIENKRFQLAVNFGYSHPYAHSLRTLAEERFVSKFSKEFINRYISERKEPKNPFSRIMYKQTTGLHNPKYFENIERTLMVAAFCGDLIPGLPFDPTSSVVGGKKAKFKKAFYTAISNILKHNERIIQWDSWRFWEALALGSVPVHIDLKKHGVELPVMPENWKHYIGINLNDIEEDVERILCSENEIRKIAVSGHEWVMRNYSPRKSAERFIKLLNNGQL